MSLANGSLPNKVGCSENLPSRKRCSKSWGGTSMLAPKAMLVCCRQKSTMLLAKTRCLFTTFSWTPTPWFTIFPLQRRRHMGALTKIAKPQLHLIRGVSIPALAREALSA